MKIEYLCIYDSYKDLYIEGPFTQLELTRYASACSYTVIKGLQEQMGLDSDKGEKLKNAISIHAIDVPHGMRNFKDKVLEMDEHWFYFYWHAAGKAVKDGCKPRFDYFRDICLKFHFVLKLPTFEQYSEWSNTRDDTYNGSFDKDLVRHKGWGDSQKDPKFKAQFEWVGKKPKNGVDVPSFDIKDAPENLVDSKSNKPTNFKSSTKIKSKNKYNSMTKAQLINLIVEMEKDKDNARQ